MKSDLISVIMGIYNCADTLGEAIDCIINQTYENWELIMCDDSSTDNTYEVAKKYSREYPDKIILIKNERNLGLNATLNNCLKEAHGEYIARMDGDDLCTPDRFKTEIEFLKAHPEFDIVSGNMSYFDDEGVFGKSAMRETPQPIDLVKGSPFCHAPCMVRHKAYTDVGGYSVSDKLLRVEDYHLWVKMYGKGYRGYNLPNVIYSMRDDRNAIKRRKFKFRLNEARVIRLAVESLHLPKKCYLYSFKPIIVGLLPPAVYKILHKQRLNNK